MMSFSFKRIVITLISVFTALSITFFAFKQFIINEHYLKIVSKDIIYSEFYMIWLTFLCTVIALLIQYFQQIKIKDVPTSNEMMIVQLIRQGVFNTWKSVIRMVFVIAGFFIVFFVLTHFLLNAPYFRIIIMIISLCTSVLVGYFSLNYLLNRMMNYLVTSDEMDINVLFSSKNPTYFILVTILSAVLFEILGLITLFKLMVIHNVRGFRTLIIELMGVLDVSALPMLEYVNKENLFILIILSGYVFGVVVHAFVARLSFSAIAVSADTAADLIGYTNYDLPENDIRNAATISDFIGDHLKHAYSGIITIISTFAMAMLFIAIFGGINGIVIERFNSMFLILLPLQLVAFGLLSFVIIELIINRFFHYLSFFKRIVIKLVSLNLLMLWFGYIFYGLGLYELNYLLLLFFGLLFSLLFFILLWYFLNPNSIFIKETLTSNLLGVIPTITKGFYYSFFLVFVIGVCLSAFVMLVFLLFGFHFNIYGDLYHLGLMGLVMLISCLPILPHVLIKSSIDQTAGIADMFNYPKEQQQFYNSLDGICTTITAIFKIFYAVALVMLLPLILLFIIFSAIRFSVSMNIFNHFNITIQDLTSFNINYDIVFQFFEITLLNPEFIAGSVIGVVIVFYMAAMLMKLISKNYQTISVFTDDSFTNQSIWDGQDLPDYLSLQETITTDSKRLIRNFIVGLILLIAVFSLFINIAGILGLMCALTITGFVLLIFFVVAGTIWKNAKLSLEQDEKQLGSSAQVSILMADKLGDIFLGCLGPIIIELIKFSFIFLILFIGFVLKFDLTLGFF